MENLHPNQTTIYDFLPKENQENIYKCKHSIQDLNFEDTDDIYCCNENCNKLGYIVFEKDCKNCKHFSNLR